MNESARWAFMKRTFVAWNSRNPTRVGAALAFYALLSIAPLLVFLIPAGRYMFRHERIEQLLAPSTDYLIGPEAEEALDMLQSQQPKRFSGMAANLLAIITLLFAASATFSELRRALNAIWNVEALPRPGLSGVIRWHLFAVGMGVLTGCVLLVSVAFSALLRVSVLLQGGTIRPTAVMLAENFIISLGVMVVLTGLIFKFVPDVRIAWKDVSLGVAVTAFLLVLGKAVLGFYITRFGMGSLYGVAGSLVAFAVWVYYSAQIVLLGAEVTRLYVQEKGMH